MKCAYCGKNNKPGALVCKRCGIALPSGTETKSGSVKPDPYSKDIVEVGTIVEPDESGDKKAPRKRRKMSKKAKIISFFVILGVIALGVLALIILINAGNIVLPGQNSYYLCPEGVIYKGAAVYPDDSGIKYALTNLNGSTAAIITKDNKLYSCYNGSCDLVSEGVADCVLSVNGSYIIFTDAEGLLWSFNCKEPNKERSCVCNEPVTEDFTVSPDGKSVLFVKRANSTLYSSTGGKERGFDYGLVPISVSDGGKHVFCYNTHENSIMYFGKKDKDRRTMPRLSSSFKDIFINTRHDEIVFSSDTGKGTILTYIYTAADNEPLNLMESSAGGISPYFVMPSSGVMMHENIAEANVSVCPVKSFEDKAFAGSSLVLLCDSKKTVKAINPTPVKQAYAADNYKTVFYIANNTLSKIALGSSSDPERAAENCAHFMISSNGRIIWYIDGENNLWYKKGNAHNLIARGVDQFDILPSGKEAIFISSGVLCQNKGGNVNKSYEFRNIDAVYIHADPKGLFYKTADGLWQKLPKGAQAVNLSKQ